MEELERKLKLGDWFFPSDKVSAFELANQIEAGSVTARGDQLTNDAGFSHGFGGWATARCFNLVGIHGSDDVKNQSVYLDFFDGDVRCYWCCFHDFNVVLEKSSRKRLFAKFSQINRMIEMGVMRVMEIKKPLD